MSGEKNTLFSKEKIKQYISDVSIPKRIIALFSNAIFQYSVMFLLISIVVFYPFYRGGKSFVWDYDGMPIMFPAFVYTGQWIREIIKNIFFEFNFTIPLFDYNIGLGSDIIQFLAMWYFEPLSLLSVFVPSRYAEILYDILVILRFYLIGISFLYLSSYFRKKNDIYSALGALVYVFSGYTFFFIRHPVFFSGLIYLPILIVAIDKIIRSRKISIQFVLIVAISLLTSYYFLYVNTLLCGIYCLGVYFFDKKYTWNVKDTFLVIYKIIVSYIWGIGLSLFAFIPTFYSYLGSNRTVSKIQTESLLVYKESWIIRMLVTLFSPYDTPGFWLFNGFSIIALVCIPILFVQKKKYNIVKFFLITSIFFLCFPVFTYILHGFNSINHRWNYVIGLIFGVVVMYSLESFSVLEKNKMKFIAVPALLYFIMVNMIGDLRNKKILFICIIALFTVLMLFYSKYEKKSKLFFNTGLSILIIVNAMFMGYAINAPAAGNYIVEFINRGSGLDTLLNTSGNIDIEDNEFFRRDTAFNPRNHISSSVIAKFKGVSSYSNQQSNEATSFHHNLENTRVALTEVYDLDNRTILDTLTNVKYYTAYSGEELRIPYGYTYKAQDERGRKLYQNNFYLPFGYTYSTRIDRKIYDKLSSLDKQEAFMQGAVLDGVDDIVLEKIPEKHLVTTTKEVNYKVKEEWGVYAEGKSYITYMDNARMVLKIDPIQNSELYLRFDGLNIDYMGWFYGNFNITVKTGKGSYSKIMDVRSSKDPYTKTRYNYMVNLGYHAEGVDEVIIQFPFIGKFPINSIKCYAQSFEDYGKNIEKLKENHLENLNFSNNKFSGTIKTDESKVLCLTIPYTKGWKAYVDKKEVEIFRVNEMFMGILVEPGNHQIELTYFTPGLKIGVILSLLSGLLLLCYLYLIKKENMLKHLLMKKSMLMLILLVSFGMTGCGLKKNQMQNTTILNEKILYTKQNNIFGMIPFSERSIELGRIETSLKQEDDDEVLQFSEDGRYACYTVETPVMNMKKLYCVDYFFPNALPRVISYDTMEYKLLKNNKVVFMNSRDEVYLHDMYNTYLVGTNVDTYRISKDGQKIIYTEESENGNKTLYSYNTATANSYKEKITDNVKDVIGLSDSFEMLYYTGDTILGFPALYNAESMRYVDIIDEGKIIGKQFYPSTGVLFYTKQSDTLKFKDVFVDDVGGSENVGLSYIFQNYESLKEEMKSKGNQVLLETDFRNQVYRNISDELFARLRQDFVSTLLGYGKITYYFREKKEFTPILKNISNQYDMMENTALFKEFSMEENKKEYLSVVQQEYFNHMSNYFLGLDYRQADEEQQRKLFETYLESDIKTREKIYDDFAKTLAEKLDDIYSQNAYYLANGNQLIEIGNRDEVYDFRFDKENSEFYYIEGKEKVLVKACYDGNKIYSVTEVDQGVDDILEVFQGEAYYRKNLEGNTGTLFCSGKEIQKNVRDTYLIKNELYYIVKEVDKMGFDLYKGTSLVAKKVQGKEQKEVPYLIEKDVYQFKVTADRSVIVLNDMDKIVKEGKLKVFDIDGNKEIIDVAVSNLFGAFYEGDNHHQKTEE